MTPTPSEPRGSRLSLYDTACAVAGGLFIGITGFLTVAALIWALSVTVGLPFLAFEIAEGAAALGFTVLTVMVIRSAMALERKRQAGALL
jgi:hypothetical protein